MFNTAGGDQINFGVGIFLTKGGGVKFCSDPEGDFVHASLANMNLGI